MKTITVVALHVALSAFFSALLCLPALVASARKSRNRRR